MTDLSLLIAALATNPTAEPDRIHLSSSPAFNSKAEADVQARSQHASQSAWNVQPEISLNSTEFSPPLPTAPRSGSQLYAQRLAALRAGRLYTRLPASSFRDTWMQARDQPSYGQWRALLMQEARAVAAGQGKNRLAVIVGDSLSLWFPPDRLPSYQLWLNQAISGDTTRGILNRLADFSQTHPQVVYVMAGVNDLKQGCTDAEILWNFQQIIRRLQQMHPRARIVLQSILPTRSSLIPNDRIAGLNRQLNTIAQRSGVLYLDLHAHLADTRGQIQPGYTTDGIHLSEQGYAAWQWGLRWAEMEVARK